VELLVGNNTISVSEIGAEETADGFRVNGFGIGVLFAWNSNNLGNTRKFLLGMVDESVSTCRLKLFIDSWFDSPLE